MIYYILLVGLPSVSWSQCLHCGSAYVAGNYSVRLYPRLKLSRRIRRRMKNKTKAENSSLSQHLLELTRKRENRIVSKYCFTHKALKVLECII